MQETSAMTPQQKDRDLADEIRQRDRRFRFAQGLFLAVILVGFTALTLLAITQLNKLNEQAAVRSKNLDILITDNQRQTEYIKCIARFFNERNRAGANLTDLDQCTIQRADGSISPPQNVPPDRQNTVSSTLFVQTETPQQTVTVAPSEPQPTIVVPETPATEPVPTPVKDPVKVLGVPVCVPFTHVCARH